MPKNSSAKYYQKNKERLQKTAFEKYQDISEGKKQQYGQKPHEHFPESSNAEKNASQIKA